MASNLQSMHL